MSLKHFSHPKHPLVLKEDDVIREDATCYCCNKPVIGSPTYTCSSADDDDDDIDCQKFYLHKSCAELPSQINHHKHNKHPLTLQPCLDDNYCDVCACDIKSFSYACHPCEFDACFDCAFEQRVLHHEGHLEHALILMKKKGLFECDACGMKDRDSSYVCTICDFWIHKNCAFAPSTILISSHHPHPLDLIYSIPDLYRYFDRTCEICSWFIQRVNWLYYCQRCTYFVHMKCARSPTVSTLNETEADSTDSGPDLILFPLPCEESLFDVIITQCSKLQAELESEGDKNSTTSTIPDDPHIIQDHWSHKEHPLELLQFSINENDNDNDEDGKVLIICDGCIQPITATHPSYYACVKCGFLLHSFCATKLPHQLPVGASVFHPQHCLLLQKMELFYSFVECGACGYPTNGFFYGCQMCDIKIDIRCAFLPPRIKYISHKHHALVQRRFSKGDCKVSKFWITYGMEYSCETCSNFRISILCAFYPTRMKHKFDIHPIILRLPPFFYEGVFYCEICEYQVNNQWWLYHCGECDHSFHSDCLLWFANVKSGGTIELFIDDQPHTLAMVLKMTPEEDSTAYLCACCKLDYISYYFFECDGCGSLFCCNCVIKLRGSNKSAVLRSSHTAIGSLPHL